MSQRLATGDSAPDFTLSDAEGNGVTLSSLRGRKVVVYFYPAAATPGCTTEACDFRDNLASLDAAGYSVLGISPDPVGKLASFVEKESLTFPLLSDEDHGVAEAYGAWGRRRTTGRRTRASSGPPSSSTRQATWRWPSTTCVPRVTSRSCDATWASTSSTRRSRSAPGSGPVE